MAEEFEEPEDYMENGRGPRVIYVRKGGEAAELNRIVLGCAGTLALLVIGIGAWGISTLVSTREEMAGMRIELRNLNERIGRLEQRP